MEIDFDKYPMPGRIRHHTSPNLYLPASELKVLADSYPPLYQEIDWKKIFLNGRKPDVLDVGTGKGKFLLDYSYLYPNGNILGLEVREALVDWLNNYIKSEKISNCAAMWYSVANGLPFIESGTINRIFYLFPDPWPKKKHLKRRAFNSNLLDEFHRILKLSGQLYIATDIREVHEYHLRILIASEKFVYRIIENDDEWKLPVTNKERFCRSKGIDFWRIIAMPLKLTESLKLSER